MKILGAIPRNIFVKFEMSLDEIDYLLEFLDNSSIKPNEENERLTKSITYVKDNLFPKLEAFYEELKTR